MHACLLSHYEGPREAQGTEHFGDSLVPYCYDAYLLILNSSRARCGLNSSVVSPPQGCVSIQS